MESPYSSRGIAQSLLEPKSERVLSARGAGAKSAWTSTRTRLWSLAGPNGRPDLPRWRCGSRTRRFLRGRVWAWGGLACHQRKPRPVCCSDASTLLLRGSLEQASGLAAQAVSITTPQNSLFKHHVVAAIVRARDASWLEGMRVGDLRGDRDRGRGRMRRLAPRQRRSRRCLRCRPRVVASASLAPHVGFLAAEHLVERRPIDRSSEVASAIKSGSTLFAPGTRRRPTRGRIRLACKLSASDVPWVTAVRWRPSTAYAMARVFSYEYLAAWT